jgi:hypothetical protein
MHTVIRPVPAHASFGNTGGAGEILIYGFICRHFSKSFEHEDLEYVLQTRQFLLNMSG